MKLLIDMNLSPTWVAALAAAGLEAVHWSSVGDPRAPDKDLLAWALANGYVVFTNDLDFGAILAATASRAPSVIQVRTQDLMPAHLLPRLLQVLNAHEMALEQGALVSLDESRSKVRILPLV